MITKHVRGGWHQHEDGHAPCHVWPCDDLREHDTSGWSCWCRPEVDGDTVIHNSADGREDYETGARKVN